MARFARKLFCLPEAVYAWSRLSPEVDTKHGVSLLRLKITGYNYVLIVPVGFTYLLAMLLMWMDMSQKPVDSVVGR